MTCETGRRACLAAAGLDAPPDPPRRNGHRRWMTRSVKRARRRRLCSHDLGSENTGRPRTHARAHALAAVETLPPRVHFSLAFYRLFFVVFLGTSVCPCVCLCARACVCNSFSLPSSCSRAGRRPCMYSVRPRLRCAACTRVHWLVPQKEAAPAIVRMRTVTSGESHNLTSRPSFTPAKTPPSPRSAP